MESIERNLTMKLYRTYCPESTRLGEYELGILDQAATAAIKTHLNDCLRCRTELEGLRIYLKDLQPEISFSLVERVRVLIAELLPRPGGGWQPARLLPCVGQTARRWNTRPGTLR
jgi:hypothetical protein